MTRPTSASTHWFDARLDAAKTVADAEKQFSGYPADLVLAQLARPEGWTIRNQRKRRDVLIGLAFTAILTCVVFLVMLRLTNRLTSVFYVMMIGMQLMLGNLRDAAKNVHEKALLLAKTAAGRARSVDCVPSLLALREVLTTTVDRRRASDARRAIDDALIRLLPRITPADDALFSLDDRSRLYDLARRASDKHAEALAIAAWFALSSLGHPRLKSLVDESDAGDRLRFVAAEVAREVQQVRAGQSKVAP